MTWRIALTGVAPEGFEDDEYENKLMDLTHFLEAFSPGLSYSDRGYTIALAVAVDDPLIAFRETLSEVEIGSEKVDLTGFELVKSEITEWEEFERELEKPTFPDVVGIAELASLLETSKQRASQLARTKDFPKPFAELASGPVWFEPNVRRFVNSWERKPGRPRASSSHERTRE